jgi:hypothetical protein
VNTVPKKGHCIQKGTPAVIKKRHSQYPKNEIIEIVKREMALKRHFSFLHNWHNPCNIQFRQMQTAIKKGVANESL